MATKNHRDGKKFGGNHTTVIDAAIPIVDFVANIPEVVTISPGFIKSGLRSVSGQLRVKIGEFNGGLILSVRGNISQQEIRIYSTDVQTSKLAVRESARKLGYHISK